MYHSDWFKIRFEFTKDYPGSPFIVGDILDANEFEGETYIRSEDRKVHPHKFPDNFKKIRWWEHRTIEQLKYIKYMKIVSGSNYYVKGDVVEVLLFMYNNPTIVGGRDSLLFNLSGHFFVASQLEPATKEEYEKWLVKNKTLES